MEVLYERCCGIDVHKSSVAACGLWELNRVSPAKTNVDEK